MMIANYPTIFRYLLGVALLAAVAVLPGQNFPADFSQVRVTDGLAKPTTLRFTPDGRILVAEQAGTLRVIKNGKLLGTPALTLNVNARGERGMIGLALDPNFASNGYVYIYYTLADGSRNRVSRFTLQGDVVQAGSERVLRDLDPLSSATNHNGGAMLFKGGKLYVAVGENARPSLAQDLDTYHGKILRMNPDGSVPSGNPFTSGSLQKRSIWSWGLRNPYTFDLEPGTGRIFVNEVGQSSWEEINDATGGGRNFGWPTAEGVSNNSAFTNPEYAYPHGSGDGKGCAITGGTFFSPATTTYPSKYQGGYFFQDYCNGWINFLDASGARQPFATGLPGGTLAITVGPDGNLYYLERSNNVLYRIIYTRNEVPQITSQPRSVRVAAGQSATFSVSATGTAPLSYQWQKDGADIAGAQDAKLQLSSTTSADAGTYRVRVTNAAGTVTSQNATLTVTAFNTPPVATITTPAEGSSYRAGQPIAFAGTATDAEDGALSAAAFTWFVDFHHDMHRHDGPAVADGAKGGTFTPPTSGETSANVWYRLYLIVTDAGGLRDTTYRDIYPYTSTIALATQPAGLQLTLDGQPRTTPLNTKSVEGIERVLGVVSPQTLNGTSYVFDRWEQGGAATQTISTPQSDVTYTAVFRPVTSDLPDPWLTDDIGSVGAAGSATFTAGTFTVTGSGSDIWNQSDEFRYVYQSLTGDGEITAQVVGPSNTNAWAKAGLMIRGSLAADAPHASIFLTPENGVGFQRRLTAGAGSQHNGVMRNSPERLRLVRKGDTFTTYHLANSNSWVEVGSATIAMDETVYIGLAVTAHSDGKLSEADFREVKITQPQTFQPLTLEAEAATVVGGQLATNHAGYTGSGFVDYVNPTQDYVEWNFSVPTAGSYQLSFRYGLASGNRPLSVAVNGATVVASLDFPQSGSWKIWTTVTTEVNLRAGSNTVRLQATGSSGANVDHLRVSRGGSAASLSPAKLQSASATTQFQLTELALYPNPAAESVTLWVMGSEISAATVRVVNSALGQTVLELPTTIFEGENRLVLDVANLPVGSYLLQVQIGRELLTRQLLISR